MALHTNLPAQETDDILEVLKEPLKTVEALQEFCQKLDADLPYRGMVVSIFLLQAVVIYHNLIAPNDMIVKLIACSSTCVIYMFSLNPYT